MWQHELRQDCSQQHSWDQLGLGIAEGAKGGKGILYLSPRMAYWLSSCRCCIEAPPVSSLPRFLCFTTSKVFSISLSLKQELHVCQTTARPDRPGHSPSASRWAALTCAFLRAWRWQAEMGTVRRCRSREASGWSLVWWLWSGEPPGGGIPQEPLTQETTPLPLKLLKEQQNIQV